MEECDPEISEHHLHLPDQLESYLLDQIDKCTYFKRMFETQNNSTMVNRLETLLNLTNHDLGIVKAAKSDNMPMPSYAFEIVKMNCIPTNVDVQDKELMIILKASGLPVAEDALVYVIFEFEFPTTGREETIGQSIARWSQSIMIEPGKLLRCCSDDNSKQIDVLYSADTKPFFDKDSKLIYFDRAVKFYVDKGRSKSLRRKFKPIKLTFYEKTNILHCDKKLGTVQVRIDGINDTATVVHRVPIMDGRRQTEAFADIRLKVHEPLYDKSMKNYEEKFLVLT